jgi:hypothetical protein
MYIFIHRQFLLLELLGQLIGQIVNLTLKHPIKEQIVSVNKNGKKPGAQNKFWIEANENACFEGHKLPYARLIFLLPVRRLPCRQLKKRTIHFFVTGPKN